VPPPHEARAFSAVGASRSFPAPGFWKDPSDGLLFLFELHGFAALARYATERVTPAGAAFWAGVVESWLDEHSRPSLPSWHPYPTSIRIVAWASALATAQPWPQALRARVAGAVARQARYLRRAVEHDIGGNHLIKNAKALIVAGAVVPSSGTLGAGLHLLRRELGRQILDDGGHEERSTSYHREVLHDCGEIADLLSRGGLDIADWLTASMSSALGWQSQIAGPDGLLPLLNDAWEGPPVALVSEPPIRDLAATGYVVVRHGDDQAIFDAGPIGPAHLPAHSHCDVLSIALWADGRPWIVDPGTFAYTGPWRDEFRRTAAHNTVELDGRSQATLWGDFRVARHPRVRRSPIRRQDEIVTVSASHDGYRGRPDPAEHTRTFIWVPRGGLVVVDRIRAGRAHEILSSLHLAPGAEPASATRIGPFDVRALGEGSRPELRAGWYSSHLGRKARGHVLEDRRVVAPDRPFGWSLLRPGWRVTELHADRLVLERPEHEPASVVFPAA
jgi:uncharacterized heparinase superfamily protein